MKKNFLRVISTALAAIICLLSFGGCSKTVKDAELRVPLAAEPKVLDPQVAKGSDSKTIIANCYEGLTKLDSSGKTVLAAARDMAVSPDGLTYAFALHTDKKWHINSNHEEIFGENWETAIDLRVTAADFVFGLQRALSPESKAADASLLYMIKNAEKVHKGELPVSALGVTAVDEFTVQISLEYASGSFLSALAEPVAMPCKQVFFEATKGKYGLSAPYILCNGPFYLSRWYEGTSIILRRNTDNKQAQASVYSVTYVFTQDEEVILENLIDKKYPAAPLSASAAKTAEANGLNIQEIQNKVWGLAFNCADETTKSVRLRLALIKTINFNEILSSADSEMSAQATGIVPPSCMIEGQSYASLISPLGRLGYDEQAAKKYYEEAIGDNTCEITVLCTSQYETAVRRIIQNWQQIFGINLFAKVEVLEEEELNLRVENGDYQCALAQISTQAQSPVEFLKSFGNGGGIFRYSSKGFDDLLQKLSMASSMESLVQGCGKAQEYLIQNGVFCPLFYRSSYIAISKKAVNVAVSHSGSIINLSETELLKN